MTRITVIQLPKNPRTATDTGFKPIRMPMGMTPTSIHGTAANRNKEMYAPASKDSINTLSSSMLPHRLPFGVYVFISIYTV